MIFENGQNCWQGPNRSIKVCLSHHHHHLLAALPARAAAAPPRLALAACSAPPEWSNQLRTPGVAQNVYN